MSKQTTNNPRAPELDETTKAMYLAEDMLAGRPVNEAEHSAEVVATAKAMVSEKVAARKAEAAARAKAKAERDLVILNHACRDARQWVSVKKDEAEAIWSARGDEVRAAIKPMAEMIVARYRAEMKALGL